MELNEYFKKVFLCYPSHYVFCPYRILPLGLHIDHQHGLATGFTIDKGIEFLFSESTDGSIFIISMNYADTVKTNIFDDHADKNHNWGDYIKGVITSLKSKYKLTKGITGIVNGMLPVGGISSSTAIITSIMIGICRVNGIQLSLDEFINHVTWVERSFIGVNIGMIDQYSILHSKKGCLLLLDSQINTYELIPLGENASEFEIAVIFTGVERKLTDSVYNIRVDECKSASYMLKACSGMHYDTLEHSRLRDIPEEVFNSYGHLLPRNWYKRAKHFFDESRRLKIGLDMWKQGNIESFGSLMNDAGLSLINLLDIGSESLKIMSDHVINCSGVYGGCFLGAGFRGCFVAIVDPLAKETLSMVIKQMYQKYFPDLVKMYSINFCKMSDGVMF